MPVWGSFIKVLKRCGKPKESAITQVQIGVTSTVLDKEYAYSYAQ